MENVDIQISDARRKPLKVGGRVFRSSDDFEITENDKAKARDELKETEETKIACLRKLKEKLGGQSGIRYRTDDKYLLRYLRHNKFDCDKAYSMICNFCSTRMKRPEIFAIPYNLESLLNKGIVSYLPYRDEDGSILLWVNYGNWKLEETTLLDLIQLGQAVTDIITMSPASQINGIVCMWDLGGLTASHIGQMLYPSYIKIFSHIIQVMHPWRVKLVILLNSNKFVKAAYNVVKHVVKKKIIDRVKFIGSDITELHKYLNPAILPKKYGGMVDDSECKITQHVLNNLPFLERERSFETL